MVKPRFFSVLDIGSAKVVCLIAQTNAQGNLVVRGIGHQISQGIRAGIIIDVKQAESCILAAVHAAEKMAGEQIDRVVINMNGSSIQSHILPIETRISGQEVTDRDINHIIAQGQERFPDDVEVLQCMPVDYRIDDVTGIRDPRGMYGDKLATDLHVVTASATSVRNMAKILARCHLNIDECVSAPFASALSCLTEDEKNLGVILLDIGGGTTSIAMFAGGHCLFVDSIALGGNHITRDIARGLSVGMQFSERIKTLYGSVVITESDKREMIDMAGEETEYDQDYGIVSVEDGFVSRAALTTIIKPRVEEMLELARKRVEASGFYARTGARVVITGGTSQLQGMKELASHSFSKYVRIGLPKPLEGLAESTKGAAFSTAVGMLIYAADKSRIETGTVQESEMLAKRGTLDKLTQWFNKNF